MATGLIPATSAELLSSNYSLSSAIPNTRDQTISNTVVCASQLDKIQDLLAQGDRRGACHYAADEKLWQHALLIASSIDKECWKEVVTEWIRAELVSDSTSAEGDVTNGRESLRVAYSLFGGNGAAAGELFGGRSENIILMSTVSARIGTSQIPAAAHSEQLAGSSTTVVCHPDDAELPGNPVTQYIPGSVGVVGEDSCDDSLKSLDARIFCRAHCSRRPAGRAPVDGSCPRMVRDTLNTAKRFLAEHSPSYLLSPQTSQLGGIGSIPKLMLLGSPPPNTAPIYYKDPDHIIFSEILEFALSLATPTKGQEPFAGLHHLQPYRLLRAATLAELGYVQQATRCVTRCLS